MGTLTEPKVGSCRIVKADNHNYAVEKYSEIEIVEKNADGKREKTGKHRREWVEVGYFGHRLDWAAESAIFQSMPVGEITPQLLRSCVKEIVENTRLK